MKMLKVTLFQTDLYWESAAANREMFSRQIENLEETPHLMVLPEMFTTGFTMNAQKFAEAPEGETFRWMQGIAADKNAAVTGSYIVRENGNYYNRLYFVLPDGTYHTYDKRHLFSFAGEDKIYTPGEEKLIVHYRHWKICLLICYDLRFPVWSRNTEDYDLLIYVANWPQKRIKAWDALLPARAIENMAYTLGVNRIGEDGNKHPYNGHSAAYDMLGEIMTDKHSKACTITVSLSQSELQKVRKRFAFLQDKDLFTVNKGFRYNPN